MNSISVLNTIGGLTRQDTRVDPAGHSHLAFTAGAGLYQFSVIADARDFDWDGLYFPLEWERNRGEVTGPWDFDLRHGNQPLVPAYWVDLDGERLGLWYFQRVSLEDLRARRFRGRCAFQLRAGGEHELVFTPYREVAVRWQSARLDVDPEDCLQAVPELAPAPGNCPLSAWTEPEFWDRQRARLGGSHAAWKPLLEASFAAALAAPGPATGWLAHLVAAWRLHGNMAAWNRALALVDALVDLPHFGNPKPDGYGHNGDMGAARAILELAWAWHVLADELGDERREAVEAKLTLQGDRFVRNALLQRDYWGGSVLQDHGWKSHWAFTTAALLLYGVIPAADEWLRFALPRIRRSLDAIPRDGVIPPSSYCRPNLYLDLLTHCRDTLLALGGDDLFDRAPLHPVVDYLVRVLEEDTGTIFAGTMDESSQPTGGVAFCFRMAAKYDDPQAAWLGYWLRDLAVGEFFHPSQAAGYHEGVLWGFLADDGLIQEAPRRPVRCLSYFPDSAFIHYRDRARRLAFATHCGPPNGYHAYHHAPGPCDRLGWPPGAGHFMVRYAGKARLVSPDSGYKLRTILRNCLLIDDQGQEGDIGYPMSIPSKLHAGEYVERVNWDEATGTGLVRLDLRPAYPAAAGLLHYIREFHFGDGALVCRDHVVLAEPRRLSWLFHGRPDLGIAVTPTGEGRLGQDPALGLRTVAPGLHLTARLEETPVVYSYASSQGFVPFQHLRFDTRKAVDAAVVDFILTPEA